MRNFDYWIVYGLISSNLVWIRVAGLGYGLAIKKTPMLFSERNGLVKHLPLPFGWRAVFLKATDT